MKLEHYQFFLYLFGNGGMFTIHLRGKKAKHRTKPISVAAVRVRVNMMCTRKIAIKIQFTIH